MELTQWFQKGITPEEYIQSMENHKENVKHIYEHFNLPNDSTFFRDLETKKLRVIVLTEDWCGDAMLNIPILLHLAEKTNMPVHMLPRDSNLELMDQYLTNGKSRSIPIFIFIDENGAEVAKWGPRAQKIQHFSDEQRQKLPSTDAEDYKEKFQELITFMSTTFRNETSLWTEVYNSLKNTLQKNGVFGK